LACLSITTYSMVTTFTYRYRLVIFPSLYRKKIIDSMIRVLKNMQTWLYVEKNVIPTTSLNP